MTKGERGSEHWRKLTKGQGSGELLHLCGSRSYSTQDRTRVVVEGENSPHAKIMDRGTWPRGQQIFAIRRGMGDNFRASCVLWTPSRIISLKVKILTRGFTKNILFPDSWTYMKNPETFCLLSLIYLIQSISIQQQNSRNMRHKQLLTHLVSAQCSGTVQTEWSGAPGKAL